MSPVTLGKIIEISDDKTFTLPNEFLEALKTKDGKNDFSLVVATPSIKKIEFQKIKSDEVIKIDLEIGEPTPDFLQELGKVFTKYEIKTIYSTGLCFTPTICRYECYIDAPGRTISQEQLKGELEKIADIIHVNLTTLTA